MEIKFISTIDDQINFTFYEYHTNPLYIKQIKSARLLTIVILASAGTILSMILLQRLFYIGLLGTLALCVFYFFRFERNNDRAMMKRLKAIFGVPENDALFGNESIIITPDALIDQMVYGDLKIYWKFVKRIVEAPGYVYLFFAASRAIFVPDRAFTNPSERTAFIALANQYWKEQGGSPKV